MSDTIGVAKRRHHTLRAWIEKLADGEPVEAVTLGQATSEKLNNAPLGKVLSWDDALP